MPELPEVEIIKRALKNGGRNYEALPGKVIKSVEILWRRTLAEPGLEEFYQRISHQVISDISRRGKYIFFILDHDVLVFHLRMSGDFRMVSSQFCRETALLLHSHDRASFEFTDGSLLFFNDARKFGRIWLLPDVQSLFAKLGPEPFDPNLTHEVFYQRLHDRHRRIKTLLLDQSFLAGTGNIYADEALHLAKIHPCKTADSLNFAEAGRLLEALRTVFIDGIENQGASIDWVYRGGEFQNNFRVYQRTNLPCLNCGTAIERCVVGQRGTHFCPVCQPIDYVWYE